MLAAGRIAVLLNKGSLILSMFSMPPETNLSALPEKTSEFDKCGCCELYAIRIVDKIKSRY